MQGRWSFSQKWLSITTGTHKFLNIPSCPNSCIFFCDLSHIIHQRLEDYIPTSYKIRSIVEELYVAGYVNYKPAYKLYWPDDSSSMLVTIPGLGSIKGTSSKSEKGLDFYKFLGRVCQIEQACSFWLFTTLLGSGSEWQKTRRM